jgi:hypothetical protein
MKQPRFASFSGLIDSRFGISIGKVKGHNTVHREQGFAVLYRVLFLIAKNIALKRTAANEDRKSSLQLSVSRVKNKIPQFSLILQYKA